MSDDGDQSTPTVDGEASPEDEPVDPEAFVEAVAEADEALGEEARALVDHLDDLGERLDEARSEVEELTSRLKRTHADFENYKKRIERRRNEAEREATRRLVDRLVDLRDNLQRAVSIDEQTAEDLIEGVKLSLNDLDRLLDAEDVELVTPELGDEVDPHRHEVMLRVASDEHPEGTIAEVFEPGYLHGDRVLREAQVAVSTGPDEAGSTDSDSSADSAE